MHSHLAAAQLSTNYVEKTDAKFIAPRLTRKQPTRIHTHPRPNVPCTYLRPRHLPPGFSFSSRQPSGKTVVTVSDLVRSFPLGPSYHFDILRPDGVFESVQVNNFDLGIFTRQNLHTIHRGLCRSVPLAFSDGLVHLN